MHDPSGPQFPHLQNVEVRIDGCFLMRHSIFPRIQGGGNGETQVAINIAKTLWKSQISAFELQGLKNKSQGDLMELLGDRRGK